MLRIREMRDILGIKQKQVSSDLNIPPNTFSQYETGKREPDLETVKRIAEYFDVSIDYLLGKTDKKNKPTANNGDELPKEMQEFMSFYDELDEDRQRKLLEIARLYRDDQRKTSDNK